MTTTVESTRVYAHLSPARDLLTQRLFTTQHGSKNEGLLLQARTCVRTACDFVDVGMYAAAEKEVRTSITLLQSLNDGVYPAEELTQLNAAQAVLRSCHERPD